MATEITQQDVRIQYVVDTAKAVAEARKVDKAVEENAKTAKKTAKAIATASAVQEKSSVALTAKEKELAAKILGTRKELQEKAKALGLTVGETKKLAIETKKLAASEEAAAKAAEHQAAALAAAAAEARKQAAAAAAAARAAQAQRASDAKRQSAGGRAFLVPAGGGRVGADVVGDVDKTTKSVKKLTDAQQQARQVTRNLGYQIGDVVNTVAAGGSPMQALGVQALDVAFQFNILTLASKALAIATGPVGLGIAAIVASGAAVANRVDEASESFNRLTANMGTANDATRRLVASQNALKLATGDVAGFMADLQLQTALMRGEVTDTEIEAGELGGTLADTLRPRLAAAGQAFAENETKIHALNQALNGGRSLLDQYRKSDEELTTELKAAQKERETLKANLDAIKELHRTGSMAINDYSKAVEEQAAADEAAKEAKGRSTRATKEDTSAIREAEAAMKAATHAAMGYVAALASIDDVGTQAARSQLDAYGRLEAQASDRLASIEDAQRRAVSEAVKAGADGAKATQAAEEHAAAARAEVWRAYYADVGELRAQDAEKAARAAEEISRQQIAQVQEVGGYIQQGVGMLSESLTDSYEMSASNVDRLQAQLIAGEDFYTEAQKAALSKRLQAQKDAAMKQWSAAKNAKVAEATASTALAAINAIAQSPPPSPFGLIGAGIATAAGMQAVAAIESQAPVFDQGGAVSSQADHVSVVAQPEEWITSKTGRSVLGDDTLRRADAGMGPQRDVYAVQVYNHQSVVTKWEADGLSMGGPTDQAIRANTRSSGSIYGHRAR